MTTNQQRLTKYIHVNTIPIEAFLLEGVGMGMLMTGTLAKWGNSQGIRIPKEACELLGIQVGATAHIEIDRAKSELILKFPRPEQKYSRSRKVSLEELCSEWNGEKVGEEWGGPDVGAEVVR